MIKCSQCKLNVSRKGKIKRSYLLQYKYMTGYNVHITCWIRMKEIAHKGALK